MKTLATKKLFYKKYAFKVCCYVRGASDIKYRGADWVIKRYQGLSNSQVEQITNNRTWPKTTPIDYPNLVSFAKAVKKYVKVDGIHIRTEGAHLNLFCSDIKTYNKIVKDLTPWVTEVTRPETKEDLEFFTKNGPSKVLVKELPHNAFKYKIVMKPSMAAEKRVKFNAWLERYDLHPKAISHNTKHWLSASKGYVQDPFFYVESDEMLTMVNLYLGNSISRTEEFVLKNEEVSA